MFSKEVALNLDCSNAHVISKKYGLKGLESLKCYESLEHKGLYVMPNPFLPGRQRYFLKRCICDYHCLPNKTNLDAHIHREKSLWDEELIKFEKKNCRILKFFLLTYMISVLKSKKDFSEFNKLRWATIGYHYNWTEKVKKRQRFRQIY